MAYTPHTRFAGLYTSLANTRLIHYAASTRDPLLPNLWGEAKQDPYAPPDQGCCIGPLRAKWRADRSDVTCCVHVFRLAVPPGSPSGFFAGLQCHHCGCRPGPR